MRVAIIGAGFSGLSVAWYLLNLSGCELTLFDSKGIGGGASGMAAGLMHPYVGEDGRRSFLADEGMQASLELIEAAEGALGQRVARREGVLRYTVSEEQNQSFLAHCELFDDIEPYGEHCFHFKSGVTVDCPRYLEGLWQTLSARGTQLIIQEVADLQELKGFDHIIVAAGAGISGFAELEGLKYSMLKGQVLHCRAPEGLALPEKSLICKGYVALTEQKGICHIGSTYERTYSDLLPDPGLAKSLLFPNIARLVPEIDKWEVLECKPALRVIRKGHYFPISAQISDSLWVLGAMGSRGLLYHGLVGKTLAAAVISGSPLEYKAIKNYHCNLDTL